MQDNAKPKHLRTGGREVTIDLSSSVDVDWDLAGAVSQKPGCMSPTHLPTQQSFVSSHVCVLGFAQSRIRYSVLQRPKPQTARIR
jgi:hypothetical protein